MEIELRQMPPDDPDVIRLAHALRDEVIARGAHADETGIEQMSSVAKSLGKDGEILLAYDDTEPVAIGALRRLGADIGEIKRMYVLPAYRGAGVARRVLEALEARARHWGFRAVRLDTHDRLSEANRLYEGMGYRRIPDYNGNPSANRWFEKSLA